MWDSTSNLVPVSDKLEATTWRTTYPATVRIAELFVFCSRMGCRWCNFGPELCADGAVMVMRRAGTSSTHPVLQNRAIIIDRCYHGTVMVIPGNFII